jgi:hypothetical protein
MDTGVSRVVSKTIVKESPSTPRWKEELTAPYHTFCTSNWNPGVLDLNESHKNKANPKGIRLPTRATHRSSFLFPAGRKSKTKATIMGENKISVKILSVMNPIIHSWLFARLFTA